MFYVSTGSALNLLFCEMCLLEHRGGYEQRQCPLPWKKAYPYQRHFSLFPACWDILHWKSHSEICKVHVLCEWEGEKNGNNRARWKKKWENAKLKYANKVVAKKKKKISQPHPKEKVEWEGEERKMENLVCLPLLSLFYEFIKRTLIMRTQIQTFLNIFSFGAFLFGQYKSLKDLTSLTEHSRGLFTQMLFTQRVLALQGPVLGFWVPCRRKEALDGFELSCLLQGSTKHLHLSLKWID